MTDEEFVAGLSAPQVAHFNSYVTAIRATFQSSYTASVAEVVAAKDALFVAKETELATAISIHTTALAAKQSELDAANATIAERDTTIVNQNSAVSNQANTITQLQATIAEKDTQLTLKNNQLEESDNDLATANAIIVTRDATIAALESRISLLLVELPFNPRIIDATAFYNRITKDEFAALSVSDDETLRTIAKTILAYKTNDWPVIFESPEFQGLIGYLAGTEFLTIERAAELTADARRAEAYNADL
jgi:hypothetical protein